MDTNFVIFFNHTVGVVTVLGQVFVLIFTIAFLWKRTLFSKRLVNFFGAHGREYAFMVALGALMGSLYYSYGIGYPPCELCWFQRIFMFPLPFMLGLSLWKRDESVTKYVLLLSGIGAVIAGYHHYLQLGGEALVPCSASLFAASCTERYAWEFGYIGIPTISLTAFLMIMVLLHARRLYLVRS